jgi:cell division initiation protein
MELSARQVNEKQFHDAWRGYNQAEVDDFLDKVAETIDRLQRENRSLQSRIRDLDQTVATSRDTEEMLKKTLVTAQQAAEEAIASARTKAEQLIAEAEDRARRANEEVKDRLSSVEVEARKRSLEADREHQLRKRELDASIERLRQFETELKQRLKLFLAQQTRALESLADVPPGGAPAAERGPIRFEGQPPAVQQPHPQPQIAPQPQARPETPQGLNTARAAETARRVVADESTRTIELPSEQQAGARAERRGVRGLFGRDAT